LQIKCAAGDGVELQLERIYKGPNRWFVKGGGDTRFFEDLYTNAFLNYAAAHGFDKACLVKELERLFTAPVRRVTPRIATVFNPVRDYLPNVGPVLLAVYVDDAGVPRLAMVVSQGGRLLVKDPSAALYDDVNDVVYTPRELPSKVDAVIDLFPHLPLLKALYGGARVDIPGLVREVAGVLSRHITLIAQRDYIAAAAWVVAAHFFPVFKYFTVLRIGKPGFNAGGTTTLKLICALLPAGRLLVDPSDASQYVLTDMFRLSLCIDEVKMEWGKEKVRKLAYYLDAGHDRDGKVSRMLDGGRSPTFYSLYGPRAIVDPQALVTSYSNVRRQLVISVLPAKDRREIPSVEEYRSRYFELWHKLHVAFLLYADDVKERYERLQELYPELDGSTLQAYGPVLAIASYDEEIRRHVLAAVRESVELTETLKMEADPTKTVLRLLYSRLLEEAERLCTYETEADDPRRQTVAWKVEELRRELREELTEVYQVDVKKGEWRQWRRLSDESLDAILGRQTFAALLRQYLSDYIKPDNRRYLWLEFEGAEALWRGLERLAAALGVKPTPPCALESLMPRDELRRCAGELAEETRENPAAMFEELAKDPERRLRLCVKRAERPRDAPAVSTYGAAQPQADTADGNAVSGALAQSRAGGKGAEELPVETGAEAPRRGGGCPEGWVFEENVKRCVRSW
jgi:hypothetical protein